MASRRFATLMALTVLSTVVLFARLAKVQLEEHEVWAREAAGLVRQGRIEPYVRGEIRDAKRRVMVKDRKVYQIEFRYRDFRRTHPLGLVTHARSALELRAVPLYETLESLHTWTRALLELRPADLDGFSKGKGITTAAFLIAPDDPLATTLPATRARDLSFYLSSLLGFDRAAKKALRQLSPTARRENSLLELAAARRRMTPEALWAEIAYGLDQSVHFLEDLARFWDVEGEPTADPLDVLVRDLEGWRRRVEDLAAIDLFRAATGFSPGRLEPVLLRRCFDLDWLASRLYWDAARTDEWVGEVRSAWLDLRDEVLIPQLCVEVRFPVSPQIFGDHVLDELASLYVAPRELERLRSEEGYSWRTFEAAVVAGELDTLFQLAPPKDLHEGTPVLPVMAEPVRAFEPGDGERFESLALVELWTESEEDVAISEVQRVARSWRELFQSPVDEVQLRARCSALLEVWERGFQAALAERFERLLRQAAESGVPHEEGLELAESRLDRAEERTNYCLIDRGSRTVVAIRDPDYSVVHLLTRYPEHFGGFLVQAVQRRVQTTSDEQGVPLAAALVGKVRTPGWIELRRQRDRVERLNELKADHVRDESERSQLELLLQQIDRVDELRGAEGLERAFDAELAGKNGYKESRGLQERAEKGIEGLSQVDVPRQDGRPITLTIDLDLQRAALECLAKPAPDPEPQERDQRWLARPTGAIVVMRTDGDVVAAASFPTRERPFADGRVELGDRPYERTLGKPDFQPPGSVFKPIVAVYALDQLGVDPYAQQECSLAANRGRGRPGYNGLSCWHRGSGHGQVDLRSALKHSCNAYFAWLGEQFSVVDFYKAAHAFGFGEPTGVGTYRGEERSGVREIAMSALFTTNLGERQLRQAGNGLAVVEATPVQVARAFAALATGVLPDARLVDAVDGEMLERTGRPLPYSPVTLGRVRDALFAVANETGGTANKALSEDDLGYEVACKTGSADLWARARDDSDDGRTKVLKHTWVAGWFPPEEPEVVFVVFVYQSMSTASHSAAWLAKQFLTHPSFLQWKELPL